MRIWKWKLQIEDQQTLMMPAGAQVLTVQVQGHDGVQLWALANDANDWPKEPRTFAVYGTGNPIPDSPGIYIATVQTHGGDLVWHVFEQA